MLLISRLWSRAPIPPPLQSEARAQEAALLDEGTLLDMMEEDRVGGLMGGLLGGMGHEGPGGAGGRHERGERGAGRPKR